METYQLADQMCARFKAQNGTTICSELKGIGNPAGPLRSCPGCIKTPWTSPSMFFKRTRALASSFTGTLRYS